MLGPVCDRTQLDFVAEQFEGQMSSKQFRMGNGPAEDAWPLLKEDLLEIECLMPGLDSAGRDTKSGCLRLE
jgi:hypothetical protein